MITQYMTVEQLEAWPRSRGELTPEQCVLVENYHDWLWECETFRGEDTIDYDPDEDSEWLLKILGRPTPQPEPEVDPPSKAEWCPIFGVWLGCIYCGDPRLKLLKLPSGEDRIEGDLGSCPNCRSKRKPSGKRCALCERDGLPTDEVHIYGRHRPETKTLCVSCHKRVTNDRDTWFWTDIDGEQRSLSWEETSMPVRELRALARKWYLLPDLEKREHDGWDKLRKELGGWALPKSPKGSIWWWLQDDLFQPGWTRVGEEKDGRIIPGWI